MQQMTTDFNPKGLESGIYRQVIENDQNEKLQKEIEIDKMKEMLDKRQNYSNYIKMVHKPAIDKDKVAELQSRITRMKHPVKEHTKYPCGMPMKDLKLAM